MGGWFRVDFARARGATNESRLGGMTEEQRSDRAKDTESAPPDLMKPLLEKLDT